MKKLMLNKGKALACLILMCLLLVQSCKKDLLIPNANVLDKSISIEEAKKYFEQNFSKFKPGTKLSSTGAVKSGINIGVDAADDKLPMWYASAFKDLSIGTNAVLTPLHRPGVYIHISEDRMVKYGFLNYLMMYKDAENKIITEWVELKPSEKFIDAKVTRKYDGKILVKDWDGNIKRLYNFSDGVPVKTSPLKRSMLASLKGTKMDTGNGEIVCLVTTTTTITTTPKTCPCLGHTYEQSAQCTCTVKPEKGNTRTVTVAKEYDCDLPFDPDKPTVGTGSPGGTGNTGTPNNPGGGTPNPGDYTPINCNPDPNYVVPTIPPPPGMEYILPCSAIAIPTDGTPLPNNEPVPGPKSAAQLLVDWFNTDPDLTMHLSLAETTFLLANPLISDELLKGTFSESIETKQFIKWGIGYLMANSNLNPSITRLENIYQLVRLQNYRPKDREPASYYWRPKLTADNWDSYLTQSTPKYIIINGEEVKNVEAYNCHFYAFGLEYATLTDDGFPKWVLNLKLKDWEEVKGNVQVGDRIVYYQDYNGQKDWTHSGIVTEVDADGYATKVSSKMGTYQIIEHHPRDIPESYGSNLPTFLLGKEKLVTPSRIYYRKK